MKFFFLIIFLSSIFCLVGPTNAQGLQNKIEVGKPDFSGTWKLNKAKSQIWQESNDSKDLSHLWIIKQDLPVLHVTVKEQPGISDEANYLAGKMTLFTDGRGDEPIPGAPLREHSYTSWKGNKLLTVFHEESKRQSVRFTLQFELSTDRKVLTVTKKYVEAVYDRKRGLKAGIDEEMTELIVFDRL